MDNFFADYPVEGGGSGGVSSLNSLTGAVTLVAGTNITITPSGNNLTIDSTGGSGADTALSNLSSVAINTSLIFGTGVVGLIQTADSIPINTPTTAITVQSGNTSAGNSNSGAASFGSGGGSGNGATGAVNIYSGDTGGGGATGLIRLKTGDPLNGNSGSIFLQTGNEQGGGNSGDISLQIGTVNAGTKGNIKLVSAITPSVGYVWTATNVDGSGDWMASGTGLPAPLEALASYSSNSLGGPGTFIGNDSDADQTQDLVQYGSTDTAVAGNTTSYVNILTGDNIAAAATGKIGNINIQGGSVAVSGAASPGSVFVTAGSADSNTGGFIQFNSGNSVSSNGGFIALNTGSGTPRGKIQFTDGSEGSANRVWKSSDTSGSGTWDTTGASGTFTTVDLKTVTVTNGLITSIV